MTVPKIFLYIVRTLFTNIIQSNQIKMFYERYNKILDLELVFLFIKYGKNFDAEINA